MPTALEKTACTLQGVPADDMNQPLKLFKVPFNPSTASEYDKGAHAAYCRLSRRTQTHSKEWKKGYREQCRNLPKKSGSVRAIAWWRCDYRRGGCGWHMTDNY